MTTLRSSSTPAKSGDKNPCRRKGIAHFESMITLEKAKGDQADTLTIRKYQAIIKCLEKRIEDEKKK